MHWDISTHQFIWQTIILTEVKHGGVLVGLDGVRNIEPRTRTHSAHITANGELETRTSVNGRP